MKIKELVGIVENDSDVRKIISEGYFLGSLFVMIEDIVPVKEWRLLFYHPKAKKIFEFFFRNGAVEKGESEKREKEMHELDTGEVEVELEDALSIAKDEFDKKVSSKVVSYFISLHTKKIDEKSVAVWTINIIHTGMNVQSYDIDARSGEIVNEESTSLVSVR